MWSISWVSGFLTHARSIEAQQLEVSEKHDAWEDIEPQLQSKSKALAHHRTLDLLLAWVRSAQEASPRWMPNASETETTGYPSANMSAFGLCLWLSTSLFCIYSSLCLGTLSRLPCSGHFKLIDLGDSA